MCARPTLMHLEIILVLLFALLFPFAIVCMNMSQISYIIDNQGNDLWVNFNK